MLFFEWSGLSVKFDQGEAERGKPLESKCVSFCDNHLFMLSFIKLKPESWKCKFIKFWFIQPTDLFLTKTYCFNIEIYFPKLDKIFGFQLMLVNLRKVLFYSHDICMLFQYFKDLRHHPHRIDMKSFRILQPFFLIFDSQFTNTIFVCLKILLFQILIQKSFPFSFFELFNALFDVIFFEWI